MCKHTLFILCLLYRSVLKFGMFQTCGSVKILFVTEFHSTETLLEGHQDASLGQTGPMVQLQKDWDTCKELGRAQSAGSNQTGLHLACKELKDFPQLYQLVTLIPV